MADYSSAICHRPCTDAGLPIPANARLGNSQTIPPRPTRPVPDTTVPLIEVSEASFSKLRFYVKREDIRVRVIESTKKGLDEEERTRACANTSLVATSGRNAVPTTCDASACYTYVTLWFDTLYFRTSFTNDSFARTKDAHHISLAYLPSLTENVRQKMETHANEVLDAWFEMRKTPHQRPAALLTSRGILLGRRVDDLYHPMEYLPHCGPMG